MNYTKAKAEVVKFNNEDVVTRSAGDKGHPKCTGSIAKDSGCGINNGWFIIEGYCNGPWNA